MGELNQRIDRVPTAPSCKRGVTSKQDNSSGEAKRRGRRRVLSHRVCIGAQSELSLKVTVQGIKNNLVPSRWEKTSYLIKHKI
jgi:hypothetical protein